jgi:hypothetical protein
MSDQSGLRVLFEAALENYKLQTGIELAEHPLAARLQDCNSVESVTAILREQAQDFGGFGEKEKILRPLKKILTVLHGLPSVANFAQDVGLVCPLADRMLNVSDPHPIASPAFESNTDWSRYSTLCMCLYLVSGRASL